MDNKLYVKWKSEVAVLNEIKDMISGYIEDENEALKGDIQKKLDEEKWVKILWNDIEGSDESLKDALDNIDGKIKTRQKKIEKEDKAKAEAEPEVKPEEKPEPEEEKEPERDWSGDREQCGEGSEYYHWAYGKMQVMLREEDYIYLRLMDKKGCKHEWAARNDQAVEIDGKIENVKEFSIYSIGRWLFPEAEDVTVVDAEQAHKMFR